MLKMTAQNPKPYESARARTDGDVWEAYLGTSGAVLAGSPADNPPVTIAVQTERNPAISYARVVDILPGQDFVHPWLEAHGLAGWQMDYSERFDAGELVMVVDLTLRRAAGGQGELSDTMAEELADEMRQRLTRQFPPKEFTATVHRGSVYR